MFVDELLKLQKFDSFLFLKRNQLATVYYLFETISNFKINASAFLRLLSTYAL